MRDAWRRFRSHRLALAGLVIIAAYAFAAIAAPWITPHPPLAIGDEPFLSPSLAHPLGTDDAARDLFSRVVYGARISLLVAGASVGLALVVGGTVGLCAGYFGRWVDATVGRVTDVMFALPEIVLALVVLAVLGPSLWHIALAIGVVYTPIFVRVCRGEVMRVTRQPHIEAARALGLSHVRIMFRHVLPNVMPALIVQTTLSLAFAILAEAALSFLGLSGETDAPSWGLMLQRGKDFMHLSPWIAIWPGVAITLAVLSFNLIGDGLQRALDPRGARH
jgi:peptide/nickel transport system permease protein